MPHHVTENLEFISKVHPGVDLLNLKLQVVLLLDEGLFTDYLKIIYDRSFSLRICDNEHVLLLLFLLLFTQDSVNHLNDRALVLLLGQS